MKKTIVIALLMLAWQLPVFAAASQYQIRVDGLTCPFCAYGIEKQLSSIEGVVSTQVNVKQGMVIVTMADGTTLNEEIARDKINKAGFSLRSMQPVEPGERIAAER